MEKLIKVKDFAKNFGLDIKDAIEYIENSGIIGKQKVGESIEISVANAVANHMTLGCASVSMEIGRAHV